MLTHSDPMPSVQLSNAKALPHISRYGDVCDPLIEVGPHYCMRVAPALLNDFRTLTWVDRLLRVRPHARVGIRALIELWYALAILERLSQSVIVELLAPRGPCEQRAVVRRTRRCFGVLMYAKYVEADLDTASA